MRSIIHRFLDIQARDAITTRCDRISFGQRWWVMSFMRCAFVQHTVVAANRWGANAPTDIPSIEISGFSRCGYTRATAVNEMRCTLVTAATDHCSKLTRTILVSNGAAKLIATLFFDHSIEPYEIPKSSLANNGCKLMSKLFATLCGFLRLKHLTKPTCHPQTILQDGRYRNMMTARLRHYVAENLNKWDIFNGPLTFAYNTQVQQSVGVTSSLMLEHQPPNRQHSTFCRL